MNDKERGNIKLIAVGGANLAKGTKMDVLASCWALCKFSYQKLIGEKTDKDIVAWANDMIAEQ